MTGEASQKAMTAERGTPIARSAAISGITPQEQKGDSAPASAASPIMRSGEPVKARAIRLSAPVAPAQAAMPIDRTRKGAVFASEESVKRRLSVACPASINARTARIRAEASQTRWRFQIQDSADAGFGSVREVSVMSNDPDFWLFQTAEKNSAHHAASSFETATPAQHSEERKPRSVRKSMKTLLCGFPVTTFGL